eukprot:TRINITY_DN23065_c0_g1_i1.p1 TRINITY_DN23065_c0_g1~~TRINITY_DN23065_c0_g1_i1.p1  ORF type:complete len:121 (-),score=14.84 TRINITY_DN23065_c0_g1_i1:1-363(-)
MYRQISERILTSQTGIQVQVFGFNNFKKDKFLGETLLHWNRISKLCDGKLHTITLSNTCKKKSTKNQLLTGSCSIHLAILFRPSKIMDFGGISFGLMFKKAFGNYKSSSTDILEDMTQEL